MLFAPKKLFFQYYVKIAAEYWGIYLECIVNESSISRRIRLQKRSGISAKHVRAIIYSASARISCWYQFA